MCQLQNVLYCYLGRGKLEKSGRIGLPRRARREIEEFGARVNREGSKLAVWTVEKPGVSAQESKGDTYNKGKAPGNKVASRGDPWRFGSHATGLDRTM